MAPMTARPAHLTGTLDDVLRRVAIIRETSSDVSAHLCADEALARILDAAYGHTFPAAVVADSPLPTTWIESALAWVHRAGQHAFGFQLPKGW